MAAVNLIGSYNYALVALSVLIAIFASYAALDLAGRVTAASGWTRVVWLLGGAGAMGTGIWSMHYIGMLAFILPIPVAHHWPTVLLSLFAAIVASVIALYVVSRQKMGASRAIAGSVLMGAGIASMHYIGMAAMRLPAICQFNSSLVVMSVVFAVLISFEGAEALQSEACELARGVDFVPPIVSAGIDSLLTFARLHDPGRAERLLEETAAAAASTAGWHQWLWQLRLTQARAELALARDAGDEAVPTATHSIEQSRARGRPKYETLGLITRASGLHTLARTRDAIANAKNAVSVADRTGDP